MDDGELESRSTYLLSSMVGLQTRDLFKQYELFLSLCAICLEIYNFISFENITIWKIAETSLPKIHMFNVVIDI